MPAGLHMGHAAWHHLAAARDSVSHEVSKLAWLMIFGVARKSLACWIDGLE
jgi:hypothetical protein